VTAGLHVVPTPMTRWTNPTEQMIRLTIVLPEVRVPRTCVTEDGERRAWTVDGEQTIEIAPGQTVEIPSKYDQAIHAVVECGHPKCHGRCVQPAEAGPGAYVLGGLSPMLVREGQKYGIHDGLVPRAAPRRSPIIAPADVPGAVARANAADDEDPAMARARARAKGGAR
jgi:hypothetical protein